MSIFAEPSASFESTCQGFATGLTGTIGVRILDNVGGTTTARVTAGITEYPASSGFYQATLTAPSTAGQYTVLWDNGTVSSDTVASEDLIVTASATPPVVSAPGADLTTLAAVRSFLQKQSADTGQDAIISSTITRASAAIMNHTEREFAPATTAATRSFEYDDSGWLDLAPYDLRTLTSVTIDTDTTSGTVAAANYRLWPYPAKDSVYTHLRLNPLNTGNSGSYFATRRVAILGNWGFASVPNDVEQACIVTVATWLRKDVAAFSTTFNIDEGALERPEALPREAVELLWRYKRVGYA